MATTDDTTVTVYPPLPRTGARLWRLTRADGAVVASGRAPTEDAARRAAAAALRVYRQRTAVGAWYQPKGG